MHGFACISMDVHKRLQILPPPSVSVQAVQKSKVPRLVAAKAAGLAQNTTAPDTKAATVRRIWLRNAEFIAKPFPLILSYMHMTTALFAPIMVTKEQIRAAFPDRTQTRDEFGGIGPDQPHVCVWLYVPVRLNAG